MSSVRDTQSFENKWVFAFTVRVKYADMQLICCSGPCQSSFNGKKNATEGQCHLFQVLMSGRNSQSQVKNLNTSHKARMS